MITIIAFYLFAALTVFSGMMVISLKNPVHSVLFLIFAFFNAAGLFVLLGAEFIAMLLVIVYVGAVAVLFLFVIMMLNINVERIKEGFISYLPIGIGVAVILLAELYVIIKATPINTMLPMAKLENTKAIGRVLYTDYIALFQVAGLILLVAMISAIVLTLRHRGGVKRQHIGKQIARDSKRAIELKNPEIGQGIS